MPKSKTSVVRMVLEDESGAAVYGCAARQRTATEVGDWWSVREQFRVALEAAPTGMIMINPQGRILIANARVFVESFRQKSADPLMGACRDLYRRRRDGSEGKNGPASQR